MTQEALEKYAQELVGGVESYSGTLDSLNTAAAEGKTAETWLEDKVKESGKTLSNGEIAAVDEALKSSNTRLLREMKAEENLKTTAKTAESLTAEQMCIDDFNNNAAKENSRYEASVDNASVASVYGRNLFDVVIKDKFTGKKLENYQIKYGDTVAETIDMIAASDAAGQKFVVPQEMLDEVQKALPGKEILSQIGGSKLVNIASNPISKALVTKCLNGDIVADVKQLTSDPKEMLKNIAGNAVTSGVISSGFLGGLGMMGMMMLGVGIFGGGFLLYVLAMMLIPVIAGFFKNKQNMQNQEKSGLTVKITLSLNLINAQYQCCFRIIIYLIISPLPKISL